MVYKVEQNKNMKLTIPYYLHKAGAGFPSPATDYIEEDIDLNMHLIKNVPATFIIRVQGKSMVDVGINDGDLLVVDKSLKPKNFSTASLLSANKVIWVPLPNVASFPFTGCVT